MAQHITAERQLPSPSYAVQDGSPVSNSNEGIYLVGYFIFALKQYIKDYQSQLLLCNVPPFISSCLHIFYISIQH